MSPYPESQTLSFKSISAIYQQKSQTLRSTEELDFLRREFDTALDEKSYLEAELRRVKNETRFDQKAGEIKAKEETVKKLIAIREFDEKKAKEKLLEMSRKEREVDNQKNEINCKKIRLAKQQENLDKREEKIRNLEYGIKLKERILNRRLDNKTDFNASVKNKSEEVKLPEEKITFNAALKHIKEQNDLIISRKQELEQLSTEVNMKQKKSLDAWQKIIAITNKL